MANGLSKTPVRSQLQTSATSRGRSATFWADLQLTYFNKISQVSVEPLINQIRLQASQPAPNSEGSGQFGTLFSFYDYY